MSARRATTTLSGFSSTPATVQLGGTVADAVTVLPRARRTVRVQARRPGAAAFVTVSSGLSSTTGAFRAVYRPTTLGRWHFRLVVPRTTRATGLISASRAVTARDTIPPGPVSAVTVNQGATSNLVLSWTNPTAKDFAGVMIRRAVGATAPASPTAGVLVTKTVKAATSFTDISTAPDTVYSYALFAFDSANNNAPGATGTQTSGPVTTAVLSLNGSSGATAKQTVNLSEAFDITGTHAGGGLTLVSGTLDYGDGTTPETFTGDSATWVPAVHQYTVTGPVTATWTVVDSAAKSDSSSLDLVVFPEPTATISVTTAGPLEKNSPVDFAITSDTPPGTTFTDFETFSVSGGTTVANDVVGLGAPPSTLTLEFPTPGTYTVFVDGFNDAGGFAEATVDVVITDAPQP